MSHKLLSVFTLYQKYGRNIMSYFEVWLTSKSGYEGHEKFMVRVKREMRVIVT